jgi:membrane associated rhomboid family serine protease
MSCRIVIVAGPLRKGEVFELRGGQPIGIGKFPAHLIQLMTPKISRNHASLCPRAGGGWRIQDNESTNGTFVNGQRVRNQELCDGDILRIGEFILRFEDPEQVEILEELQPRQRHDRFSDHDMDDDHLVEHERIPQLTGEDQALPPISAHIADASIDPVSREDGDLYDLIEPEFQPVHVTAPAPLTGATPPGGHALPPSLTFGQTDTGSRTCMSCGNSLDPGAKVCITCGIDLTTGQRLITAHDFEDDLSTPADTRLRAVSRFLPIGVFPTASEALARRKPYATWIIFALTLVCSCAFLIYIRASDEPSLVLLNLMHWTGSRDATDKQLTPMIDTLVRQMRESETRGGRHALTAAEDREIEAHARVLAADLEGAPQGIEFHWYQLLTSAFLHNEILPLTINLLFLLVFGLRVNEVVGNWKIALIYPLLAIASSWADGLAHAGQPLQACLGASGAIMGLAGMYLVLVPIQRVRLSMWIRPLIVPAVYRIVTVRGIWLLLIWLTVKDLLPILLKSQETVAHWAHLGGFAMGMILAIGLLLSGSVDADGADLLSIIFGTRKQNRRQTSAALT